MHHILPSGCESSWDVVVLTVKSLSMIYFNDLLQWSTCLQESKMSKISNVTHPCECFKNWSGVTSFYFFFSHLSHANLLAGVWGVATQHAALTHLQLQGTHAWILFLLYLHSTPSSSTDWCVNCWTWVRLTTCVWIKDFQSVRTQRGYIVTLHIHSSTLDSHHNDGTQKDESTGKRWCIFLSGTETTTCSWTLQRSRNRSLVSAGRKWTFNSLLETV